MTLIDESESLPLVTSPKKFRENTGRGRLKESEKTELKKVCSQWYSDKMKVLITPQTKWKENKETKNEYEQKLLEETQTSLSIKIINRNSERRYLFSSFRMWQVT